jgi:hypothetical protein
VHYQRRRLDRWFGLTLTFDQWYGPQVVFFKVRANDGNGYILRRRSSVFDGEWSLESFRDMRRGG